MRTLNRAAVSFDGDKFGALRAIAGTPSIYPYSFMMKQKTSGAAFPESNDDTVHA